MPNNTNMPDDEVLIRARLQRAVDQASDEVPDSAGTPVRRRLAASPRRRVVRLVGGAGVAAVAALGLVVLQHQSPAAGRVAHDPPPIAQMAQAIAADPLSCPASIARFIAPATREAVGTELVPGRPSTVHACSYSADVVGRTKYESYLVGPDLFSVVTELNSIKADQGPCPPGSPDPVLLRFGYGTGDEVDVMLTAGNNCSSASNGVLTRWSTTPISIPLLGQTNLTQQASVATTTGRPGSVATTPTSGPDNPPLPIVNTSPTATGTSTSE